MTQTINPCRRPNWKEVEFYETRPDALKGLDKYLRSLPKQMVKVYPKRGSVKHEDEGEIFFVTRDQIPILPPKRFDRINFNFKPTDQEYNKASGWVRHLIGVNPTVFGKEWKTNE